MAPRLRDIGQGRRDVIFIDPSLIRIEQDWNPRDYSAPENRAHLDALKAAKRERAEPKSDIDADLLECGDEMARMVTEWDDEVFSQQARRWKKLRGL